MANQSNVPDWMAIETPAGERLLPVYLLLDTSSSMQGAPIRAVQEGLEQFQREVAADPFAREVVKVGVITFSSNAQLLTQGLVPITAFTAPPLEASGVTRLDLAFDVLLESMDRDVKRPVKGGQKGDWRPVVFVLTDGRPTDANGHQTDHLWIPARDRVVNREKGKIKPGIIVAVGCGPGVDEQTLKAISTGVAFRMGTSEAAFVAFFQYLTQSIVSSVQPGVTPDTAIADVPLPPDIIRIP